MPNVLIVGGGVSGCLIANELSINGFNVTIVEQEEKIGGKVIDYGCKATNEKCNDCGVCLTSGLWESVLNNKSIDILTSSAVIDILGEKGDFTAIIKSKTGLKYIGNISNVIISTGFSQKTLENYNGFVELNNDSRIITGSKIENILKERNSKALFDKEPESVAFIQCYGSRDKKENAMYCSKVCCNYSTRAAKVIKEYYPNCNVTFFYMEMQMVKNGNYFKSLEDMGFEFIKCRPIKVKSSDKVKVLYDNPEKGNMEEKEFDIVVLSDGIFPNESASLISEISGLSQDETGFLRYIQNPNETGVYLAGCAGGPKKIAEVHTEALIVAREIQKQSLA